MQTHVWTWPCTGASCTEEGLGWAWTLPAVFHGELVLVRGQLILILSFGTVELNEVGFKFVRKCINAVETKGERLAVALNYFLLMKRD